MIAAIFKHAFTDVDRVLLHYPQAGRAGDKLTRIEVNIIMTNVKVQSCRCRLKEDDPLTTARSDFCACVR
jgi:hypothetical protein